MASGPFLRPLVSDLRGFVDLCLAVRGKRRVTPEATPFGYTKGSMAAPAVLIAVSLVEALVVHFLVPWEWLRIILLVLTVWGMFFIFGFFATRIVHPHFVTADALHLRWGHRTVLVAPLANVASATRHTDYAHAHPHAEGTRLILTQFQATNVLIRFTEPVPAGAPVPRKLRPADFHATEVQLHVDDPDAFLQAVRPLPDAVTT